MAGNDRVSVRVVWEKRFDPLRLGKYTRDELAKIMRTEFAYAMRAARNSMKMVDTVSKRTGKRGKHFGSASRPGTPPNAHRANGMRQLVRFAVDEPAPGEKWGVLGFLPSRAQVGMLHEFGGVHTLRNKRRTTRGVGQSGEVVLSPSMGLRAAMIARHRGLDYAREVEDYRGQTRYVLYRISRTMTAAYQANRHNERLYGPRYYNARYPARPTIHPVAPLLEKRLEALTHEKVMKILARGS